MFELERDQSRWAKKQEASKAVIAPSLFPKIKNLPITSI
jgi:hypothetical protein